MDKLLDVVEVSSKILSLSDEQKEAVQTIEDALVSFAEGIPALMSALDELATIHPAAKGIL